MCHTAPVLLLLCLAASLPAQRTFVIDVQNGLGTDYTTVAAGIGAAQDGDRLLIRSGTYECPASIAKAITLQGTGTVVLQTTKTLLLFHQPIQIHSIGAGRTFAFRDLEITTGPAVGPGVVHVVGTAGAVILDRVKIQFVSNRISAVHAERAQHVVLRDCNLVSSVTGTGARILVEGGTFSGQPGDDFLLGTPAFAVQDGELSLAEVRATGGNGAQFHTRRDPAPAVVAGNSRVLVRGKGTTLAAGQNYGVAEAVRGDATSTLLLDSNATLAPTTTTTPRFTGFKTRLEKLLPVFRSANTPVTGQRFECVLRGHASAAYIVLLGLPGSGAVLLPLNESFLLTPSLLAVLWSGTLPSGPSGGEQNLALQLSSNAKWAHWNFAIQGATAHQGVLDLTNALILGPR